MTRNVVVLGLNPHWSHPQMQVLAGARPPLVPVCLDTAELMLPITNYLRYKRST